MKVRYVSILFRRGPTAKAKKEGTKEQRKSMMRKLNS